MRTTRALAAAGAAVAALGLAAPAAVARDGMGVSPSNIVALPSVIARGGQLTVTVDNCPTGGTMTSDAFPSTTLTPIHGAGQTAKGTATINDNARPGSHSITVNCNGRTLTNPAAFTVIGGVQGGIGGSRSTGAAPADIAIGGGLVAAAVVGGGVFWVRRRSEKRI
ncbi:hypothetical protein ACFYO2_42630 [Streptomyces sp. NPDC006602]|uniref:hypothetical protein n=1 Tax=Streptomyces sp. NPDC006602 TaxID=3364751 RepID=UPI003691E534